MVALGWHLDAFEHSFELMDVLVVMFLRRVDLTLVGEVLGVLLDGLAKHEGGEEEC